jgi:ribose 5-phosphate isomerase A
MSWREDAKKRAASEAVKNVRDGFVIGLGSGSTVAYAICEIGRKIRNGELSVVGVPASYKTFLLAVECGIPLTSLNEHPRLNLTIDGADQIDEELNLIKGRGGALTREKIIASASDSLIIVVDETKLTKSLGEDQPVPIEVMPFALPLVTDRIKKMGGRPELRERKDGSGPYVTDNGNFIIDADFGVIEDPKNLNANLKRIPGIIETGLFIGMTEKAYVGTRISVRTLRKPH